MSELIKELEKIVFFSGKRCEKPRHLDRFKNGTVTMENSNFEIFSSITFDCDEGFYMPDADAMTCSRDERWQPVRVPRCYSKY